MKKIVAALSAAVMLLGAVAGLTACGGGNTACTHNYEEDTAKRVAATCHSDGTKYLVCSECGDEKTEAITQRPAHTFTGDWVKVDGENHAKKCSSAGCEAVDTTSAAHNYVEDTTKTVAATCHSDGEKALKCGDCGAEKTEPITQRPNHNFTGDWQAVEGGHAKKCINDGCTAADSENIQPHQWGEQVKVTDETFYHEGVNESECEECGAKQEIKIPALDHMGISIDDTNWKFGTSGAYNFEANSFVYTQLTQKNGDGSGYTDGKPDAHTEIKPDWFCNETFDTYVVISYTFEEAVDVNVVVTFRGVGETEGPLSKYWLRIGKGVVNGANVTLQETQLTDEATEFTNGEYVKSFNKGETIFFVFKHATDGWDQGHYSITINKANPTDNAE